MCLTCHGALATAATGRIHGTAGMIRSTDPGMWGGIGLITAGGGITPGIPVGMAGIGLITDGIDPTMAGVDITTAGTAGIVRDITTMVQHIMAVTHTEAITMVVAECPATVAAC